jgi:putative RecB family exonuclease
VQKTFSPSSLNCFENCPKQYHFRYIEQIRIDVEGIEAFVGKRVHEVLERLYLFVEDGAVPSLDRVIWRYRKIFGEAFDAEKIRIVREGTKVDDYLNAGARGIENYYRRHYPFDEGRTLGLEKKINLKLDDEGRYAIRGIVDRVTRARDGSLEIHDYKTGRRVPRQQELDRDRQLGLYELALREQLGETGDVRLVWHYVVRNTTATSCRTHEQREQLRRETIDAIDRIRDEEEWKPRRSGLCGWCEYKELCPAFAEERQLVAERPDAAGLLSPKEAEADPPAPAPTASAEPAAPPEPTTSASVPAPAEERDGQLRLL